MKYIYHNRNFVLFISGILISACNGGSDGDSPGNPPDIPKIEKHYVQVIDGYLQNASVCVDRNRSLECDDGEYLAGFTDNVGLIEIAPSDRQFGLIAKVIEGTSKDGDDINVVRHSYTMAAPAGEKIINPFTTLAVVNKTTIDEVAANLDLPSNVIKSDYASSRAMGATAQIVAAMARSITDDYQEKLVDTGSKSKVYFPNSKLIKTKHKSCKISTG